MALTKSILTGRVVLPTDAAPINAELVFTLSGLDSEGGDILPPGDPARCVLVNGELPPGYSIWRNTEGYRGTHYIVTVMWTDMTRQGIRETIRELGKIQVGDNASYVLADLLAEGTVPAGETFWSAITEAEYDAVIDAADRAEAAAAILTSSTQTFLVPTDYASVQLALVASRPYRTVEGAEIIVMIESGHQIATPISMAYCDLRHVRIASEGATVTVASGFNADTNVAQFIDCDCPIWDILLDCQGRGRNGVWLENSTMEVKPSRGVQNAGASGTLDPRGCGFFAWKGASLQSTPSEGPLTGIIARGCAWRGVDITHNSQASIVAADLTNNGTDSSILLNHAALFVSRASNVQADNSRFTGSVNGIRSARSTVTARSADFQNISGCIARQFEGGLLNCSNSNMSGSGGDGVPLLFIEGTSETRPQGGGQIVAENCDFNNVLEDIAKVSGSSGLIVLDNSTGTDILGRIAIGVSGKISMDRCSFTTAGLNTRNELILASYSMYIDAYDCAITAVAGVDHIARAANNGYISCASATFTGCGGDALMVEGSSQIYSPASTFDTGVTFPALLQGPMFAAAATPEQFAAAANGTADDKGALVSWAARGGLLSLTSGATYRVASRGPITFAAGSIVKGNGATILLDYTDTSNNYQIETGAVTKVSDLNVKWSGANYAERGIRVEEGASWIGGTIEAVTEQPDTAVDESSDATVTFTGANARLSGVTFRNIWKPIRVNAADGKIKECDFYLFGKGIAVEAAATALVVEANRFHSLSSYGTQAPGEGPLTGAANGLTVRGNTIFAASEHGLYVSGDTLAVDVVIDSNTVFASGQSNYKTRNCDVKFTNNTAQDAAFGNSTGTTEDAAAFEDCPNVFVNGFTAAGRSKSNAGNYALRFDSCAKMAVSGVVTERAQESVILITDERIRAALGGYEHVSTLINGLTVQDPGAGRLMDIVFGGDCGDVEAMGISFSGGSGTVLTTDIAGTAGKIMMQGAIDTTGTMHVNTAGGASVLIEAFWDRYVGGSLQRSYVDGKFTMYSGQFDLTAGATLGQFVRSTGTEATGAYIGGYGGSRLNSGRPGWAMVGKQGTSDADQVGAAILVKHSSATSDILVEAVEFAYNLHAKFAATVKTAAYAVSALPSASSLGSGARAMVSDGSVVAAGNFGNVVAGGGANIVPVYSDGTNWRIG